MRIVSTSPDNTEIVCALGARSDLVGVSKHCDYPEGINQDLPVVSDFAKVDVEAVLALEPDVVLCSTYYQGPIIQELVENHVRVFVSQPQTLASVLENISWIANLIGRPLEGAHLVSCMQRSLIPRPGLGLKVFAEEWGSPIIMAAPWIHEMITLAGGTPVLAQIGRKTHTNDRILTPEAVVVSKPDVVLMPWCGVHGQVPLEKVMNRPGWERLPAVQLKQLFPLEDSLFVRPGPRLVDGIKVLIDLFGQCRAMGAS